MSPPLAVRLSTTAATGIEAGKALRSAPLVVSTASSGRSAVGVDRRVDHEGLTAAAPPGRPRDAPGRHPHAHPEVRIGDQPHGGRLLEAVCTTWPTRPGAGDDRHAGLDAVARSLVDLDRVGEVADGPGDHAGGRGGDVRAPTRCSNWASSAPSCSMASLALDLLRPRARPAVLEQLRSRSSRRRSR